MILHNRVNKKILKEKIQQSDEKRITLSFYRYVKLPDPQAYRDQLYLDLSKLGVFGRIYVAEEGVNAQISVPEEHFDAFEKYINASEELQGERLNVAVDDDGKSFFKLKIQVRNKIVADGLDDKSFDVTKRGVHLKAEEFNKLANDPNTVIVDMRNHYEVSTSGVMAPLKWPTSLS